MINEDKEIKKIKRKYNERLQAYEKENPFAVKCYLALRRINRANIYPFSRDKYVREANRDVGTDLNFEDLNQFLLNNSQEITKIMSEFAQEIKSYTEKCGKTISHISKYTPNELGGVLQPMFNVTMYNESKGEFVFGSADELNKKMYATRIATGGIIRLYDRMFIFPSIKNLDLSNGIRLKTSVYSYDFSVRQFEPVVSLYRLTGKLLVRFDDEWISYTPQLLGEYHKIEDVSQIVESNKIFVNTSGSVIENSKTSRHLADMNNRRMLPLLKGMIKKGEVCYLNAEVNERKKNISC